MGRLGFFVSSVSLSRAMTRPEKIIGVQIDSLRKVSHLHKLNHGNSSQ